MIPLNALEPGDKLFFDFLPSWWRVFARPSSQFLSLLSLMAFGIRKLVQFSILRGSDYIRPTNLRQSY